MNGQQTTKPMAMLLQDPSIRDASGEYLHEDWQFPLDQDYLLGTGSSKFVVRDSDQKDTPLPFDSGDWSDSGLVLTYDAFNSQPLERPIIDNAQFHQVNAFAVASHTLRSFEEALGREISWRHGGPLVIRPHAFEGLNAYYNPEAPSLNFGYFRPSFRPETVWTCLSHDIVAHELGHAILDSFLPLFSYSLELDVPALHESIGDLLALFSALEYPPVVERMYRESGGDMRRPTLLSRLAEEFGIALGGTGSSCLRSALDGPPYDQAPQEAHARSTVWTAALYDILVGLVETIIPPDPQLRRSSFNEFQLAVVTATRRTRRMMLRALSYAPPTGITMPVLARVIYEADQRLFPNDPLSRDIAKQVFGNRRLWDETVALTPPDIGPNFQDWGSLGVGARAALVAHHAEALRVPAKVGTRLLAPQLATAVREADAAKDGVQHEAVTERYLRFAYEMIALFLMKGANGLQLMPISVLKGGTLVLDESWNDLLLVTDPPLTAKDLTADNPTLRGLERMTDRFDTLSHQALRSIQIDAVQAMLKADRRVVYGEPCWPFVVESTESGAARFIRRRCNIADHVREVSASSSRLRSSNSTLLLDLR